jgi:hypothetical protein
VGPESDPARPSSARKAIELDAEARERPRRAFLSIRGLDLASIYRGNIGCSFEGNYLDKGIQIPPNALQKHQNRASRFVSDPASHRPTGRQIDHRRSKSHALHSTRDLDPLSPKPLADVMNVD